MGCAASHPSYGATPKVAPSPEPAVPAKVLFAEELSKRDAKPVLEAVAGGTGPDDSLALPAAPEPISTQPVKNTDAMTVDDVFSWLRWSPRVNSPCGKALGKYFPGALPVTPVVRRTVEVLHAFDTSICKDSVIYGESICPDEINHDKNGLSARMVHEWGSQFPMGGIGGAPFVGTTGFGAFSHHVPDDGHVFILFGPHIAVSDSGELGKYLRIGQHCQSSACGAVLAAYNSCKAGEVNPAVVDMSDMQQSWLRQTVHASYDEIAEAPEPLETLIKKTYAAIEKTMLQIVNHNFGNGKLILLGGIQLNLPNPYDDHFQPLMFRVSSNADPEGVDLLPDLYHTSSGIVLGKMTKTPKANAAASSIMPFSEN